jgi:hypothetical protein
MITGSVLLYHNGNQRIIDFFQQQFRYHTYQGNWSEHVNNPKHHSLYEICIADATDSNLQHARNLGIRILRYITCYNDDQTNSVSELKYQDYQQWLTNVVCKNLCFADIVESDSGIIIDDKSSQNHGIIITTGRTANTHLQMIDQSINLIEYQRNIGQDLISARQAILLWRLDQWQCLTSSWILQFHGQPIHQFNGKIRGSIKSAGNIPRSWVDYDWKNVCQLVLDTALFFRYIIRKPVYHMTTEDIISRFQSHSEKIRYSKKNLIPNFDEIKSYYDNSDTKKLITLCYNNTLKHII